MRGVNVYKKCPRCALNYIRSDEDYCEVCKVELSGLSPKRYCYVCGKLLSDDEEDVCSDCLADNAEKSE